MKIFPFHALVLMSASIIGCSSVNKEYLAQQDALLRFLANKPKPLQPFFKTLYEEGERNAVLNFNRLGLAALESKDFAIASKAFDNAINIIDIIYSDNAAAESARSKFNEEKVKDFKGEAYERAMSYYYRGLLYLHVGEFDNARASFLAASLQDKFSEDQTYNQDFAVMDYLAGWSSMCLGDQATAKDHLRRATTINPSLSTLVSTHRPYLVILETGYAPKKVRSGKYNEILKFTDNPANINTTPHVFYDAEEIGTPVLASDILFQATTRGGRPVDAINAGKAEFKESAETAAKIGSGMTVAGAMLAASGNYYGSYVGSAGLLVNLISSGVASATTPEADARTWESLPKQIYLMGADNPPTTPAALSIKTDLNGSASSFPLHVQHNKCGFTWAHTASPSKLLPTTEIIAADTDDDRGPKNEKFRSQLLSQF